MANSVSSIRNGKPVINKREIVQSIYNNNNGDETYEEHRFEDDNSNVYEPPNNIIELMNNHNLSDDLNNEELPKIGFDEVDEVDQVKTPQKNSNNVNLGKISSVSSTKKIESRTTVKSTGATPKENSVSNYNCLLLINKHLSFLHHERF